MPGSPHTVITHVVIVGPRTTPPSLENDVKSAKPSKKHALDVGLMDTSVTCAGQARTTSPKVRTLQNQKKIRIPKRLAKLMLHLPIKHRKTTLLSWIPCQDPGSSSRRNPNSLQYQLQQGYPTSLGMIMESGNHNQLSHTAQYNFSCPSAKPHTTSYSFSHQLGHPPH